MSPPDPFPGPSVVLRCMHRLYGTIIGQLIPKRLSGNTVLALIEPSNPLQLRHLRASHMDREITVVMPSHKMAHAPYLKI